MNALRQDEPWLGVFELASASDWEDAKSAFLTNGPHCLNTLASFTYLIRLEAFLLGLLRFDGAFHLELLQFIRNEMDRIVEEQPIYAMTTPTREIFGANSLDGIRGLNENRVAALCIEISREAESTTAPLTDSLLANHFGLEKA